MEQTSPKHPLRLMQTVFDSFEERATDMDIILPDYCPEIAVILKCTMTPCILRCFQSGDRYSVDGTTQIRILYLSDDRTELYCHETSEPFSAVFHVENAVHYDATAKTDYVNCRAISARRMDIHGAFRIYLTAVGCTQMTTVVPHMQSHICYKSAPLSTAVPIMQVNKSFSVAENMPLDADVDRIIYSDCIVTDCEHKVLTNKVIVKGRLKTRMMVSKKGVVTECVDTIPFSHIVDAEGVNEDVHCRVTVQIGEKDVYAQINESSPSTVSINAKLMTSVYISVVEDTEVVLDAYSVNCPLLCETMNVDIPGKEPMKIEREVIPLLTTLPENTCSLIDVWGTVHCDEKQGHAVSCCYMITALIRDHDGHISCFESTIEEMMPLEQNESLKVCLISVKGMVSSDQLHIQAEIEKQVKENVSQSIPIVTEIIEDKQSPFPKTVAAIRIVYADKGDSVWNIAKEHHAVVDDILHENDLDIDMINTPTVLMIPV